nr:MAG TPA: hypothetical protein [Caudoviricetes sp.]
MHDLISVNNRSPIQFQRVRRWREYRHLQVCRCSMCQNVTFETLNPKVQGSTP